MRLAATDRAQGFLADANFRGRGGLGPSLMASDRHIVSVDEVAELLRKAKARVPPAENLRHLADAMTMMGARYLCGSSDANTKPPRPPMMVLTLKGGRVIAPRSQRAQSRALTQIRTKGSPLPQGPQWPDPKSGKRPSAWHLEADCFGGSTAAT
jgi:hypothetical protein